MWYLTSESDPRVLYVVPHCNEMVVGRSTDASIYTFTITNDASISRKHALLSTTENNLFLKDFSSSYGTFVNDLSTKVQPNMKIQLKDNDVIRFGKLNSLWRVHEKQLITCTSTVKGESMQNIKELLNKMGGKLKSDWDETCIYLTMPAVTLTIKVVLALVQGSYIVTPDFWDKSFDAIQNKKQLPNPTDYTPQLIESSLDKDTVSFFPDKKRQMLWKGKKVIFLTTKQYEMYKMVLRNCAGEPLLLDNPQVTISMCVEEGVVVIQTSDRNFQDNQDWKDKINAIVEQLHSKNKRLIADAEIGLSILYNSTDIYCNPDYQVSSEVMKTNSEKGNKTAKVLAPESQDHVVKTNENNVVINESLISNDNVSGKRKLSIDSSELGNNATKKQAIEPKSKDQDNIHKRKFSEDGEFMKGNPSKKLASTKTTEAEEIFNFLEPDIQNKEKKLNLSKPQKRKADFDRHDDNLFNFVQDENINDLSTTKHKMFDIEKKQQSGPTNIPQEKKTNDVTPEDISAMRGVKLQELMQNNMNHTNIVKRNIKKEDDELDSKMKELDLGSTIVIVKPDLIVKKEPIYIESSKSDLKNFKKFTKVWPVKRQANVIESY